VLLEATKDIVYSRRLLKELQMCEPDPMPLLNDNQSCIKLVDHPILHAYTKHVEIQITSYVKGYMLETCMSATYQAKCSKLLYLLNLYQPISIHTYVKR
jgi:hypothetical protein